MSPLELFDLSTFEHRALFQIDGLKSKTAPNAWDALKLLHDYLMSLQLEKVDVARQKLAYFEFPELISIGEGTVIEAGAYIRGPCVIGKNCTIRHGAYIRGDVLIGDNCVVGHTTELKHSILLDHAKAAHFAFVGDSILGNDVNLGAGVKCANLRLDGQIVKIHAPQGSIVTGMRKLGSLIGDRCQIGCNTVLNPGTVLGKDVLVYPANVCSGVFADKSIVQ